MTNNKSHEKHIPHTTLALGGEPASLGLIVILRMKKETMLGEQQNGTDKDSKKRKTSRKKKQVILPKEQ